MVILGKDVRLLTAMTADFLFADSKLGIVTGDEEGVLRVYEFDPTSTFLALLTWGRPTFTNICHRPGFEEWPAPALPNRVPYTVGDASRRNCHDGKAGQGGGYGYASVEVAIRWDLRCSIIIVDLSLILWYSCAGSIDGSLSMLTPLNDPTFKRLHLLQGQLTRNIQHVAGLNPKAFRYATSSDLTAMID